MLLTTINQILILFGYMGMGFFLCRGKFLPENTPTVISRLLNYILMPATIINTFMDKCTVKNFVSKWHIMLYSSVILLFCIIVGLLFGRFFHKDPYIQRIYRYSFTVCNFAFLGIAFVEGVAPELLFDYLLFILPLNLYTFSLGVAWLIPTEGNNGFSFKSFLNPICISLLIGAVMGLTNAVRYIPEQLNFLPSIIGGASKAMSPMAMILTGFVIGSYPILSQLKNYKVYIIAVARIFVMPLLIVVILNLLNTPKDIVSVALCANAMPLGLNTVIIPSAYGKDPKLGGSLAIVSQLMCIITIPLLFGIFLQ